MRKNRECGLKWLAACALTFLSGSMWAQVLGERALADGHFEGARQQLECFLAEHEDEKGAEDAEALRLVCDYVLGRPGTADRAVAWAEEHPLSQYADIVHVLGRNLLVKESRFDEALQLFFNDEKDGFLIQTPLAYPLSDLSNEACSYNGVIYRLAGERLYDEGRLDRALIYLEAGEQTRTSRYKLGMCHYRMGAYAKAHDALTESASIAQDEMAQSAWLHAGIAALQLSRKADAQKDFQKAADMTASAKLREQATYNYCLTLHDQSAPTTVARMEQFLKDFPSSQWATPVSQCLAEVYMTRKDYSRALSAINKVAAPDAATQAEKQRVLYQLAFQELNQGKAQQALAHATEAVALGAADVEVQAEAHYVMGDANYRLAHYAEAAQALRMALDMASQTAAQRLKNEEYAEYTLGYSLFKQQKYTEAIAQFRKVTTLEGVTAPMKADAFNRLGDCHLNLRDYDEAKANYETARTVAPALGDYSLLQQAYIEGLRGDYERKVAILKQMQELYPNSTESAKALYEQGRAFILSGREDEAVETFTLITLKHPGTEYAQKAQEELDNVAANIAAQRELAAAQEAAAVAEAKAPVEEAQRLLEAGQLQQAEQRINKAIDEGIGRPYWLARAFILLADIYRAEGREVEAKQTLESLKANYKEDDDIKGMIERRLKN